MAIPIENVLDILEYEFKELTKLFNTEDWKFFKFGRGGPYKRYLTKLQTFANEHDQLIFNKFGRHGDNASFNGLVIMGITNAGSHKEKYGNIGTFRRQLKRMRGQL